MTGPATSLTNAIFPWSVQDHLITNCHQSNAVVTLHLVLCQILYFLFYDQCYKSELSDVNWVVVSCLTVSTWSPSPAIISIPVPFSGCFWVYGIYSDIKKALPSRDGKSVKNSTDEYLSPKNQHKKRVFRDILQFVQKSFKYSEIKPSCAKTA